MDKAPRAPRGQSTNGMQSKALYPHPRNCPHRLFSTIAGLLLTMAPNPQGQWLLFSKMAG